MAARSIRSRPACCRSRLARRPSSPAGCSTPTRSMISRSASGGDRHARRRRRGGRDLGAAADAGGGRGGAAALHRPDRAGAAGLFGAEGRRQARLRSGPRRRGVVLASRGVDHPRACVCRRASGSGRGRRSPPRSPRAPISARLARDIARALGYRRPRHHVAAQQGRAVHPRTGDFAGQIGRSR